MYYYGSIGHRRAFILLFLSCAINAGPLSSNKLPLQQVNQPNYPGDMKRIRSKSFGLQALQRFSEQLVWDSKTPLHPPSLPVLKTSRACPLLIAENLHFSFLLWDQHNSGTQTPPFPEIKRCPREGFHSAKHPSNNLSFNSTKASPHRLPN